MVALATDTWEPTGWANNPEFKQFAVVERVVEAPNGQFYVSFYNQGIVDGVRDGAQLGQLMRLNADGSIDESFNVGPGWTRFWGIGVQADGKVVAGGISSAETSQTGLSIYRVFRFNTDGSLDDSFNSPVFNDIPRFITLFPDNSMIVVPSGGGAGNGGISTMAYLEADGSMNLNFTEPDLAGGVIFAPVVSAPAGQMFIAGSFGSVNGVTRPGVAKLNNDGSLDTTFVPSGFNPDFVPQQVRGIGLQTMGANAGKLIVAGGTIVVPGSDDAGANRPLIRLNTDGSLDTSFTLTTQADAGMGIRPRLLEIASDDSITIVGSSVRRFDAEGNQVDSATYARSEFSSDFFWMEVLDDGSVIVPPQPGASINGNPVSTLTKFAPDGSIDAGFNAPEFVGNVYPGSFHSYDDGRFLVWGNFDTANGESRPGIARFWSDGILEGEFAPDFIAPPAYVTEASVAENGRILVSTRNPATGSSSIVRLNSDGSVDNTFVLDGNLGDLGGLRARQLDDGKVILTGLNLQRVIDDTVTFTLLDAGGTIDAGFDASGIATPAAVFREPDDSIRAVTLGDFSVLAEDDQGRLIVSSTTGAIGENATTMDASLLRINRDGSIDQTFSGPTVSWPSLGVSFPFYFNGTGFEQFPTTTTGSPFRGVEILGDGSMYVYGFFRNLNGSPVSGVARLFSNGAVDSSFDVGTGPAFTGAPNRFGQVTGLYPMENGRVFVAGYFYEFNEEPLSGLVLLESDGSRVQGFHTSPDLEPYTGGDIGVQKSQWDDHILVGGTFRSDFGRAYPDAFMRLRQVPLVEIFAQPKGLSLMPGQGGVLRFDFVAPQADVTFQWFKGGVPIDGATGNELYVTGDDADLGSYYAEITGGGETIRTDEVWVEIATDTESWRNVDSFSPPDFVTDRFVGRVVPDGNGGYFASYVNGSLVTGANGQTLGPVVRLNGDGSVDPSFNIGNELSNAWAILPLADGSVLVGGEPSAENGGSGFSHYYVYKFDANGNVDPTFNSPTLGGLPRFMSLQPDGKIVVIPTDNNGSNGGFQWITRLNADGSWDDTFHQVWLDRPIFAPPVFDAAGKIYIGGFFREVDGAYRPGVARLNSDGTRDDGWYPTGMDSDNPPAQVRGLAVQGEGANAGKLLVAGGALNVPDGQGGSINSPVIRLNSDGSLDNSFSYVTQGDAGMAPRPRLLHKFADDSFIVVGATVTRFLADGAIDLGYTMPNFDAEAFWFAVNADGSVVVPAEPGTNLNGSPAANLVKLLPNGLPDSGFVSPQFELFTFPGRILTDGSSTYVVGGFDRVGGVGAPGIAKLNYDGSVDSGFSVPAVTFPNTVAFADLDANGRIVAALRDQNTGERSGIIRLNSDGSLDGGFNLDPTLALSGIELLTRPDNAVLIWSDHPQYLIDDSAGFGLLMDNGTLDETFGPNEDQPVLGTVYRFGDNSIDTITQGDFRVLAVADDGSFIARTTIGDYPQWAGSLEHTIKRYYSDGTEDQSFNAPTVWWGTGLNFPVVTDAQTFGGSPFQPAVTRAFSPFSGAVIQDDGKVIIFGSFNDLWGHYSPGIARLNADGSVDTSFDPGGGAEFLQAPWRQGSVSNVSLAAGGRLWVTGFFDAFSGYSRPGLTLLEPNGQTVSGFGTDLEFRPWITSALTAEPAEDGTLLVGGSYEANGGGIRAFHRLAVAAVEDSAQLHWRNPRPWGGDLTAVIHDGSQFVAVGTGSQVIQSADGMNWSYPVFFPEEVMNGIAFDGSTYVTVGGGGAIYTSTDLSNWTFSARDQNFRWLFDVEHSNGLFVAVGDGGNVMVSDDGGANWTSYSAGVDQTLQEVAAGAGKFVTVSWNGVVLHSADGQTWTQATLPGGFENTGYHSIDFVNGEFVVFGDNGAMLTSSDGMTWAGSTVQNGEWLFGVVFDGTNYLAITGDDRVLQSTDLGTWTSRNTGNGLPIGSIRGIAQHGGTAVVVGAGNLIRSSTDSGSSWMDHGSVGSTSAIHDIEWFDGGFHAVGSSGSYLTSPDGVYWTVRDTGSGHWFNAIARGAGVDVIATGYGYMLVDSGSGWQEIDVGDNNDNRDLIFAGNSFHAVGSGGTYRTSVDGTNWTTSQITGYENQNLQSIALRGGVMVVVGDGGLILRSDNGGTSWTDHSTGSWQGLTKVRVLDGLFVVVGQDRTVLLSDDGMNWDQAPVPNDYVNFGWGYADVGRGPDAYYVVSTQGRVLRTTDWTNWTQFWGIESKPDLVALAASPNRLAVGGSGGAILSTGPFANDGSLQFPGGGLDEFTPFAGRGSATLSVFATGPGDLTYTWDKDGQILTGENLPFLNLTNLSAGDAGLYTVTVTSSEGPILTSSTELFPVGIPDGDGPIYGVGDLPGGADGSQIRAATLVNDVIHAVGGSGGQSGGQFFDTGILWRSDEGLTVLPNIVPFSTGTSFVTASAITPDGRFIAARGRSASNNNNRQATRIDTTDFTVDALPFTDGLDFYSAATAISDDGSVVYAFALDPATNGYGTVRHEPDSATTMLLEIPAGNFDRMFPGAGLATTSDGSIMVGSVANTADPTVNQAYLYQHGVGVSLVPLPAGGTWSAGQGITADGGTVLITGDTTAFPNGEVYLLDTSDDSIEPLGSPMAERRPNNFIGMSSDASVVVAIFIDDNLDESDTFIRNQHGWFRLDEVVVSLGASLDGWELSGGLGVSGDGRLVFGAGERNGILEGFVVKFPEGYLANYAGDTNAVLFGLGGLPGGDGSTFVRDAVYAGGGIAAVGNGNIGPEPGFGAGGPAGFFWSLGEGMNPLPNAFPDSTGTGFISASALTPDGSWIAARTRVDAGNLRKATRVNPDDLLPNLIPEPADIGFYSAATAISDDGNLVGGFYVTNGSVFRGFITEMNSGLVTTINPDDRPEAENVFVAGGRGLSADGTVAVGNTSDNDVTGVQANRGFRYTSGTGLVTLPLLDGGTWSRADSVSDDGQITLLTGDSTAFPNGETYLHDANDGSVTPLGSPNGDAYPSNLFGMNSDGSVIGVSFANVSDDVFTAYIRNQNGWFTLEEAFIAAGGNSEGWDFSSITGISREGRLAFGSGLSGGSTEGFVIRFPDNFLASYVPRVLAGPVDPAIVGAWRLDEGDSTAILIFTPDGHYAHMQDVNTAEPDAMTGYELGRFEFNLDGSFLIQTDVDTNGDIGLSDTSGRTDMTAAIANNQLSITIPDDGTFTLDRIDDDFNSLVGGWSNEPGPSGETIFVVFDDQNRYYLLEDGATESNAQPGIEWGTFTWNSETGAFATTNILIDQNGDVGLSDPGGPTSVMLESLGYRLVYNNGEDFPFRRVAIVPVDIETQPAGDELAAGEDLNLSVAANGDGPFTYQWRKDGVNIDGATDSSFMIMGVTADDAGTYDVIVTGPDGSVLSAPAVVTVAGDEPSDAYLSNLSVRSTIATGDRLALPFRIEGPERMHILLRAIGPTLSGFGVSDAMADPRFRLVDDLGFEVVANDDWEDNNGGPAAASAASTVGAFGLASGSADAALYALLDPGSYTLLIDSAGSGGTVISEIYFVNATPADPNSRLVYLAALGDASAGQFAPGFVNIGSDNGDLLLRAVGPGTGLDGASGNPSLTLVDSGQQAVTQNDDWDFAGGMAQDFIDAGAFPLADGSTDAAALAEPIQGSYTAQIGGSPGRVLFEVYDFYDRTLPTTPVLLVPAQPLTVTEGDSARFEAIVGSAGPISMQWLKDGSPVSGVNSAVLILPSVSLGDAGDYVLRLTNGTGSYDTAPVTLTVLAGASPPSISSQPADTTIQSGGTATLNVTVVSTAGNLGYQWYEGTSGDTSAPISGATSPSFTTPALSTTTSYWLRANDDGGSVDSNTATVTVAAPSDIFATHSVVGGGYIAGGTVTITTTFTYTGPATALGLDVTLPAGWSYASTAGDDVPPVPPGAGTTGNISWAYLSVPASPVSFTYTLNVPESQEGAVTLNGVFRFRDGVAPGEQPITVTPDPLTIEPAAPFHSADTDEDNRLSLSELLRVIELYNTRNGTTRTGHYKLQDGTEDGFAPDPTLANSESGNLTRFHSADFDQDGKLSLSELLRVIELYNYRSGTTRTGEYRTSPDSEDGFAPGPEPEV